MRQVSTQVATRTLDAVVGFDVLCSTAHSVGYSVSSRTLRRWLCAADSAETAAEAT